MTLEMLLDRTELKSRSQYRSHEANGRDWRNKRRPYPRDLTEGGTILAPDSEWTGETRL